VIENLSCPRRSVGRFELMTSYRNWSSRGEFTAGKRGRRHRRPVPPYHRKRERTSRYRHRPSVRVGGRSAARPALVCLFTLPRGGPRVSARELSGSGRSMRERRSAGTELRESISQAMPA